MFDFDRDQAKHYESWFETPFGRRVDRSEKRLLTELLTGFGDIRSILEVGCGTGHFTRWFHEMGIMAIGVDISNEMM